MSDDVILTAKGLTKHFGGGGFMAKSPVVQAVSDISLEIRRGETFAIVGESGCGKSTLARLLMRLLDPTEGQVTFDGQDISHVTGADLTRLRERKLPGLSRCAGGDRDRFMDHVVTRVRIVVSDVECLDEQVRVRV